MRLFVIFFLLLYSPNIWAQDTLQTDIDQIVEDAATQTDNSDVDWTQLTDFLNDLRRNPMDLNKAGRDDLAQFPFLSQTFINNLTDHIRKNGPLLSLYELQAIPGMSRTLFDQIKPFVTVNEGGTLDIRGNQKHPQGPELRQVFKEGKFEYLQRWYRLAENQPGYLVPEDSTKSYYLGSPDKIFTRIKFKYLQNVSFALIGEKDAGEQFLFNNKQLGFDFISGHVAIKNYGHLKSATIGDFNLSFGQGIIFSRGLGFGKGAETINSVKAASLGTIPYSSVNENQYYRGATATVAAGDFYLMTFASKTPQDANVSAAQDSTDLEPETSFGLLTSGLHRTQNELSQRQAASETAFGGRVAFQNRKLHLGSNFLYQHYSVPFAVQADKMYKKFDFTGTQNYLNGFDFDWVFRNFNWFGELARSSSGGIGGVTGILASLDPRMDLALHLRYFGKNFHSLRGYAFSERPYALQNEQGIYIGIKIYPTTKWVISSYFDQYYFEWYRYLVDGPSRGWENLTQVQFKPSRSQSIYLRFRTDKGARNRSNEPDENLLHNITSTRRHSLRLDWNFTAHRTLKLHARAEHSWYEKTAESKSKGFLLYQDVSWQPVRWLSFTGRYLIFNTQDYNSRIYAYENNVLAAYSVPAFQGTGTRAYLIIEAAPLRWLDVWLRVAQTRYDREKTISSGLDEIQGNRRTEITLQTRLKF